MTASDDDKTKLRATDQVDATAHRSSTELRTQVRSGVAAADETQLRPTLDATARHDSDATLRTLREDAGTAARTLKAGVPVQDPAFAATLQAPPGSAYDRSTYPPDAAFAVRHGPLQPGSVIKQRFVLESMLGKGGMGLVFGAIDRRKQEARDPNPYVALKVLNADFQRHPQSFMALQREARKAQTLAHPNVVTVFDFDRDGDDVYMTMELLTGRTLESIVRDARGKGNGADVTLPIIRGIAEGLAYAHRKGIVHSDLKPGNVFIAEDGTAKILDFGIARAVPSSVTEKNKDEFDAGTLGAYTEAYATDEMMVGTDPHPADDMYALGIIAYELVTGMHPYHRHSAPNARQLGLKPAPLKGLKRKQARAIESCLSFDRKHRPQNAGEFLKEFRGVTALQRATLVASAVLAVTVGYLWYQNYVETSPSIPFRELPAEVQQRFRAAMQDGNEAWVFYEREHLADAMDVALTSYSAAYELHPRNREAVAALNRAADEVLRAAGEDAEQRRQSAKTLQTHNAHFRKYAPVVAAAKD
jgi:predicted Ser/Thr protein kinase